MQNFIHDHLEEIADLCRRHHVRHLAIFGSFVRNDFDPARSDVDLLVEFAPLSPTDYAPNYFALLEALDRLFARRVDLVIASSIKNPYFKEAVEKEQQTLYAAA
ncbi:MAG TPA: nucleotidyltransferase domain-containing protein [Edaphobacter sp.]|nr:nucleotidyltransferase domain-containing protein [Edaphobacter sp.]